VFLARALTFPENDAARQVQLVLRQEESGGASFRIYSREDSWTLHSEGVLQAGESTASSIDLDAIRARCTAELSHEAFYSRLWDRGYHFGSTFRTIGSMWRGDGEVLCRIDSPLTEIQAIDCCLQLPAGLIHDLNEVYLPIGLDRFSFHRLPNGPVWGHAVVRTESTVDVRLADETGAVFMEIAGLQSRVADPSQLGEMEIPSWTVQWTASARRGGAKTEGPWLVIGEPAIAEALERRGQTCRVADVCSGPPCRQIVYSPSPQIDDLLSVLRSVVQSGWPDPPRLWLLTRGAAAVLRSDKDIDIRQAWLHGIGRTITYEHPELRCTLVDLDPTAGDYGHLATLLLSDIAEDQVALRQGTMWAPRLSPYKTPFAREVSFRADATYLITGGLGGLGLQVARWLAGGGAGNVVLLGRTDRRPQIEGFDAKVAKVILADVADRQQLSDALAAIDREMPPLRGVFHLAGMLDDGMLLNLTRERFEAAMAPKAAGAWNLHELTTGRPLDHFVLFSSASATVGSPGQGNYAAANAFLDALAHLRRAQGLPAVSIAWGPWKQVGLAAQANRGDRLAARGISGIRPEQGLRALSKALSQARPHVAVMNFDMAQWLRFYPQAASMSLLAAFAPAPVETRPAADIRSELLAIPAGRQRRARLETLLMREAGQVLRLDPSKLDGRASLGDIGFDSLMALEFRNRLESSMRVQLSATLIWRYPTFAALTQHLADKLGMPLDNEVTGGADSRR
jgi:NAD(P)-dependent dehydrogenase (short-subunit alcohol dehydrogenase family)/acyl carrier protein